MLYAQDRGGVTLGTIVSFYDDTHTAVLEQGVSTFDFKVDKNEPGSEWLIQGNYVVMADEQGKGWKFTIINTDETHSVKTVHCEDLGLELLSQVRDAWTAPAKAQGFKYYFDKAVLNSGWELGVNEANKLSRTLSWEGRATALERLLSICTQFGGLEIEFRVEFRNLTVIKQYVDVRIKRGAERDDVRLNYNDTVSDINKTVDGSELSTALMGVGAAITDSSAPEGTPEKHVDFSAVVYDDGLFYSPAGDKFLRARVANRLYNIKEGYLENFYDYDTSSPQELLNRTLTKLKEVSEPKVNYTVDTAILDTELNLGDTVTITDATYNPPLYLSARVLQLDKCYTDPAQNSVVFGNFLILYSTISDDLRKLQQDMSKLKIPNNFTWTRYAEDENGKGMTAAPNIRTTHVAFLSNRKTGVPSDDPADYAGHWILIKGPKGDKGADGDDGVAGKDGVGVKATVITYAQSTSGTTPPTASWTASVPTLIKGQYLWTKTVWTYTDSDTETGYTVSYNAKDGNTGSDGRAGKDGTGIKSTVTEYVGAVSGTSKPANGWSTTIPTVPAGQYLWTRTTWQYTDGTSEQGFTNALMGRTGAAGADGVAGKDGIGIKSTAVAYQASSNGTTAPTGAWTADVPSTTKGQYLWTRTIWTYTDSTNETSYSVAYIAKDGNSGKDGIAGKDGVGIKSTTITYATSSSGTTTPTNGWVGNPPFVSPGQFMWTKTVWNYTDNSSETGYSVAQAGNTGATGPAGKDGIAGKNGVGIKSTTVTYQLSSSGTAKPTGAWSATVPTLTKGQYLWTKTTWAYSDSTNEDGFSVAYIAKDGSSGTDGLPGKDGVGIKSTMIEYAVSSSGVTKPTTGWSTNISSVAPAQFMWTRTTWIYTDNTNEVGYSVAQAGAKGPKGDTGQGIPGTPGTDGRTPYLHTAWANSFNGKIGFSTDVSTNKSYMGTYVNFTEADPTDPALYNWIELVGALEIGGINLIVRHDELKDTMINPSGEVALFAGSSLTKAVVSVKPGNALTMTRYNGIADNNFRFAFYDESGAVVKRSYNDEWSHTEEVPPKSATFRISYGTNLTVKLERGRKSSEYTLAPEDTQEQFKQTNDALIALNDVFDKTVVPVASVTAPPNPKEGQGWWVLNSSQQMIGFKIYKNGAWADAPIQQSAMNIGTLNGNIINGATINSSNFNVAYDETKENTGRLIGPYFKGTQIIKGGSYLSDYTVKGTTQTGFNHITPDGITTGADDANGRMVNQATLGRGYLVLSEQGKTGVITGDLNAQDSYRNSTDSVAWLGGWGDWGNGNGLIHVVRNGRLVTLSGYPHHNNTTTLGNIFQLPAWAKPVDGVNISAVCYNSSVFNPTACKLFIDKNGLVNIANAQNGGYVVIGASYVAQDM